MQCCYYASLKQATVMSLTHLHCNNKVCMTAGRLQAGRSLWRWQERSGGSCSVPVGLALPRSCSVPGPAGLCMCAAKSCCVQLWKAARYVVPQCSINVSSYHCSPHPLVNQQRLCRNFVRSVVLHLSRVCSPVTVHQPAINGLRLNCIAALQRSVCVCIKSLATSD